MELKPCGTNAAYHRHRYRGETPCDACRAAAAAYQLERKRRQGQKPYTPPRCGTHSGYCRHIYLNEDACAACKKAHSQYQVQWMRTKRRRARRGAWWEVALDYLETYGAATPATLTARIRDRHPDVTAVAVRQSLRRLDERGWVERLDGAVYRLSEAFWNADLSTID